MLSLSQQHALDHIAAYARTRRDEARAYLEHILEMSNLAPDEFRQAVSLLKSRAQVALHFHPDRLGPDGLSVAESLLRSGVYRSQFETGLSNGSLSAQPGGARDLWEQRLFGSAYNLESASAAQRPRYGALNLFRHPDGPAPRFGSCYLLLRPELSQRCTFSYRDSHLDPPQKGTLDEFDDILCGLFTEAFENDCALGLRGVRPRQVLDRLSQLQSPARPPASQPPVRALDHYIEAQVHSSVSLLDDATTLVADPSFRQSPLADTLGALAERYQLELQWHGGFSLAVGEVPDDFRGPNMPPLAARVAQLDAGAELTARSLGEAARSMATTPDSWSEFGDFRHLLQQIKRLWHVLVRYGRWHVAAP